MQAADQLAHNASISVTEMDTFLRGTDHEPFSRWMLNNRQYMFKKYDRDKDGGLTRPELEEAIAAYFAQNELQPNVSGDSA